MPKTAIMSVPECINAGAKQYGYYVSFDPESKMYRLFRQSDNQPFKQPLVALEFKKNRLRILMPATKELLFSGGVSESAIGNFLESFYFAKKIATSPT